MTLIIAYINKETNTGYIAGDRMRRNGTLKHFSPTTKLLSCNIEGDKCIIGMCGLTATIQRVKNYIEDCSPMIRYKDIASKIRKINRFRREKNKAYMLIITESGKNMRIASDGAIVTVNEPYNALGAGQNIAKGILHYTHYLITGQHNIPQLFYKIYEIAEYQTNAVTAKHDIETLKLII